MMDDKDLLISRLKEEIRERDRDINLAAIYGKQLYEETVQLSSKVDQLTTEKELLEQEKHILQLDLERQIEAVKSHVSESDLQRDEIDDLSKQLETSEKEKEVLHKKIENMKKENNYLKQVQQDLDVKTKSLEDEINILRKQVKNFEDLAEKSLCEIESDENEELKAQLNTYMLNNKELSDALSASQHELEMTKKNEKHLLQMVQEFEESLKEKNSELSTCRIEIKEAKEQIEELQSEIEVSKFNQVDVNRRGNSVFAELDDRRNLVEKEYKILQKKYVRFQKDYEENLKELDSCRSQMAIMQSMTSRDYQQSYIDKLEDSLSALRKELCDLGHKHSKAVKNLSETIPEQGTVGKNEYDYLRVMLKQLQQREKELQSEVANLKLKSIYDNDKIIQVEHRLYISKVECDSAKQETVKLKQQVKELERGIMHKLPDEPKTIGPKIEILDGFKPLENSKENKKPNKIKPNPLADLSIIPGELELGEDGFRQVKPPRKSNKFMLQEFNRIKPDDEEETVDSSKSTSKQVEICSKRSEIEKLTLEMTEPRKLTCEPSKNSKRSGETEGLSSRSCSKKASNRMNDNCAQQ